MAYHGHPHVMSGGLHGAQHQRPNIVNVGPESDEDSYYYDEDEESQADSTLSTASYMSSGSDAFVYRYDPYSSHAWDGVNGAVTLDYDKHADRRVRFAHNVIAGPALLFSKKSRKHRRGRTHRTVFEAPPFHMMGHGQQGGIHIRPPGQQGAMGGQAPPMPNIRPGGPMGMGGLGPQPPPEPRGPGLVTTTKDGIHLPRRRVPPQTDPWSTTPRTHNYRVVV